MKRVFIAVPLSRELQQEAERFAQQHHIPVRWVVGSNLHITLVPPWQEGDVGNVKERLRQLQTHKPFDIAFNIVEYGPSRQPRLIWAAGETTKQVLELQEHAQSAIGARHSASFKLHATLARFRHEDYKRLPKLNERIDWRMRVTSVVLMESHLLPTGSEYEVLEEVKFT